MPLTELKMTPVQLAALVDAAFRTPHPLSFLDAAVLTLKTVGRHGDGTTTAWIACLYAEGEIEAVMSLRAAWRRGEDRSAAEAGKAVLRCRP